MTDDPLAELKGLQRWVNWAVEDPPKDKRPYSPTGNHPTGHDIEKEDQWGTYQETHEERGFVLTDTGYWGVDIDDVAMGDDGLECVKDEEHDCDLALAERLMEEYRGRSYWEHSPSGDFHMLARETEGGDGWTYKGEHAEVYHTDRYLTVTEDEVDASAGSIEEVTQGIGEAAARNLGFVDDQDGGRESAISAGVDIDDEVVEEALEHVDDNLEYHDWLHALYALHSWDHSEHGMEVAMEWSRNSPKYDGPGGETETQVEYVWDTADPDGAITIATLFGLAKDNGWQPPADALDADWEGVLACFRDDDTSPITRRNRAFEALTSETEFLAVRDTENLWRFDHETGVFREDGEQYVGQRLEEELGAFFTRNLENEVVNRVRKANWADRDELGADLVEPLVACENCVVNLQTGERLEHSPEHRLISRVPVEYDPDADCPEFQRFLEKRLEDDKDRIATVYEVMAAALAPGLPLDNFVILHGPPGTGKSTLLKVMERLVGKENAVSEGLHRLANDNHAMTGLYGAKANLAGDMDGNEVKRTRLILQLSGGDTVTANPKGETPFQFQPQAEMVFSTNELPKFTGNLDAIARRLVTIEVPTKIPKHEYEPMHEVLARLTSDDELSGVLNRAVEAYQRLLRQTAFTVNQDVSLEQKRRDYRLLEDPVEQFLEACTSENAHAQVPRSRVYQAYQGWRAAAGAKDLDKGQLTERLTERDNIETTRPTANALGMESEKDRVRCYQGLELNSDGCSNADAWESRDDASGEVSGYADD
jgi:P4 family phage/plasmid primase-like protien